MVNLLADDPEFLATQKRPAAGAAASTTSVPAVGTSNNLLADDPDFQRQQKLKQIAYQAMGVNTGNKTLDDLAAVGQRFANNYSWGMAGPVAAADVAGNQAVPWPAGTSYADKYAAGEAAYDQRLKENTAYTGAAGSMAAGAGTIAGLVGPAEIAALTKAGDVVKGATAARGPVLKWLGEHSFKPALDLGTGSAVQGAAENRGSIGERLQAGAVKGAENAAVASVLSPAISATTGAVSPLVTAPVKAVYNRFAGPATEAAAPAAEAGATAAAPSAAPDMAPVYDRFRGSNTAYSYNQLADFSKDLTARMGSANINAAAEPIATKIYNATGTATPEEIAALRSEASGMTGSADPHQQRVGQIMVNALDDFTGGTSPAKTSLAPDELNSLMNQYRQGMGPPTPAPAADVGAGAPDDTAAQSPGLARSALGLIHKHVLHPGVVGSVGPSVAASASMFGADPVTASIIGGAAGAGAIGLRAGLGAALRQAPEALSPAEQAIMRTPGPSREKLALMQASHMLLPVMATSGGGGGGGGY
jgi:hypothetical protein